ncbi:MAG: hypothetical protein ACYTG1_00110 [Planctomycetota bacterium]|jgi:hypothetical protein
MTRPRLASAAALALALAGVARADTVERRGGAEPLVGRVTNLSDAGVTVRTALGKTHVVSWDRVRDVRSETPEVRLDDYRALATDLWRSRTRIERGDPALAEPGLERLFARFAGQTHETALVVAEGLLRCRLHRGARVDAVLPALETARLRRAGVVTASYAALAPVLDEELALAPALAPVWLDPRALLRLERDLDAYAAGDDDVLAALADLYRRAVLRHLGRPAPDPPDDDATRPRHPGVRLLDHLDACADPARMPSAWPALERELRELPPWCEAWARFVRGRTLLGMDGTGRRQRGMVELAHLPARFARPQPFLAGVALACLADGLGRDGDAEAAETIRAELRRRFPGHPVLARPAPDAAAGT